MSTGKKTLILLQILFVFSSFFSQTAHGEEAQIEEEKRYTKKNIINPDNIFSGAPQKEIKKHKFFAVTDVSSTEHAYAVRQRPFVYEQIKFTMQGKEYYEGIIFDTFKTKSTAVCQLGRKYSSLSFQLGHIEGSEIYSEKYTKDTLFKLYYDNEAFPLNTQMLHENMQPLNISIPLKNCDTLKLEVEGGGGLYAIVNLILTE